MKALLRHLNKSSISAFMREANARSSLDSGVTREQMAWLAASRFLLSNSHAARNRMVACGGTSQSCGLLFISPVVLATVDISDAIREIGRASCRERVKIS